MTKGSWGHAVEGTTELNLNGYQHCKSRDQEAEGRRISTVQAIIIGYQERDTSIVHRLFIQSASALKELTVLALYITRERLYKIVYEFRLLAVFTIRDKGN